MGLELGSLLVFCRSSRCARRKLPICSLKMCLWRTPSKSLRNTFSPTPCSQGTDSRKVVGDSGFISPSLPVLVSFPVWGWHSGKGIRHFFQPVWKLWKLLCSQRRGWPPQLVLTNGWASGFVPVCTDRACCIHSHENILFLPQRDWKPCWHSFPSRRGAAFSIEFFLHLHWVLSPSP